VGCNTFLAGSPLSAWAVENVGTKIFITGDDNIRGNEEADFFANGIEKASGANLRFVDRVMTDGSDMKDIVKTIASSDAEVVFAAFSGKSAQLFLKEYFSSPAASGKSLIGPESLTAYPLVTAKAEKEAANVRTLTSFKKVVEFTSALKQKLKKEPTEALKAAEGYEIGMIIAHAVSNGALAADPAKAPEIVESVQIEGPRGKIAFDKNHEPILDLAVRRWEKSGGTLKQHILNELGTFNTPDFGCGRIGFPKKPESDIKEEEPFWDDRE
jgi:ABC-type branched-subunit amino acid transport system substrate-binding protein